MALGLGLALTLGLVFGCALKTVSTTHDMRCARASSSSTCSKKAPRPLGLGVRGRGRGRAGVRVGKGTEGSQRRPMCVGARVSRHVSNSSAAQPRTRATRTW